MIHDNAGYLHLGLRKRATGSTGASCRGVFENLAWTLHQGFRRVRQLHILFGADAAGSRPPGVRHFRLPCLEPRRVNDSSLPHSHEAESPASASSFRFAPEGLLTPSANVHPHSLGVQPYYKITKRQMAESWQDDCDDN